MSENKENLEAKKTPEIKNDDHLEVKATPKKEDDREVILEVKHLKQFFKFGGHQKLKAVNDISFKVYKGEVFGLVGESGCGKTTTGRTIIKLYKNTSGDVYYKGQRISAGTRWNEKEIKYKRIKTKAKIAELKTQMEEELSETKNEDKRALIQEKYNALIFDVQKECDRVVKEQQEKIRAARYDNKYGERDYARHQLEKVKEKYDPLIEKETDPEKKAALIIERHNEIRLARKARMMTSMQMIFQDPISSLDPRMTVKEIISEGLIIRGIKDKKLIEEKVYQVLEYVGLVREHANRYPHEFSGGQRQRIGIARAIVMDPDLIIADEPVSALDVSIQAQVINLLNDLRNDLNLSIIFIAHNLSVVKYFADRIAVMYFGKIVELATSEELFKHPLHPYTRSLLSAIPLPDPNYEKSRVRITYNPLAEHDYSVDKPSFREVYPGHFVMCNEKEFQAIQEQLKNG